MILIKKGTPNGQKASITLEELGLGYEVKSIQISKNVQKEEWFLKINPNGRIPALVDRTPMADGRLREKRVFESGAMMLYLCQKYDPELKLNYEYDTDKYWEVVEWLMWMQSGLGPMQVLRSFAFIPCFEYSTWNRVKQIISSDMRPRKSNTVLIVIKQKQSDSTKSWKIASHNKRESLAQLQLQTLKGLGSLVTK